MAQSIIFQFKRATAAYWTAGNYVLYDHEFGYESDTGLKKKGDGVTPWNSLPYDNPSSSASSISFTPVGNIAATNVQAAIAELDTEKLAARTAITAGTKTKISYGADGLVLSGADATTADIADSLNKRYVSDAHLVILGNTSGVNTGDETQSTIKSKLGAATGSLDGYLTAADWTTFNSKQPALGFTPENVVNKENSTLDNSAVKYPTNNLVKTYVDSLLSAANAMVYKGPIDCSANPNYPAASTGWVYLVSVAGKIGGASGVTVDSGDLIICNATNAGGTQAAVGSSWNVVEKNLVGAVSGPASATNNGIALFDLTTGKLIKDSGVTIATTLGADNTTVPTSLAVQTALNGKEPTITVLPISKGGTNSGTALSNNRLMRSSAGAIIEAPAITAARALISDANGIPTHSVTTGAELAFLSGVTSAVQTQLGAKEPTITGSGNTTDYYAGDKTFRPLPSSVAPVFGSEAQEVSADAETSTTSTTFQTKASLTFTPVAGAKYRVAFSCEVRQGTANRYVATQLLLDGATVLNVNSQVHPTNLATNSFPSGGIKYLSGLSVALHTIDLKFKCESNGGTAYIKNARIEIWRVS